jgi:hypothetical protein
LDSAKPIKGVKFHTVHEIEPEIPKDAKIISAAYGNSVDNQIRGNRRQQSTVWIMTDKGLYVFRRGMLKNARSLNFLPIHLISGIAIKNSLMGKAQIGIGSVQGRENLLGVDRATAEQFISKAKMAISGVGTGLGATGAAAGVGALAANRFGHFEDLGELLKDEIDESNQESDAEDFDFGE